MTTLSIKERFNVKENVGAGLGTDFIQDMVDMFRLQAGEEKFALEQIQEQAKVFQNPSYFVFPCEADAFNSTG